jgi:tRNA threonylcarbamoyladenosine biosynthesis protein TsaE
VVLTNNEKETMLYGRKLAAQLQEKDVVFIFGDLGAGKTCLVKGIAEGFGISIEYVRSPTFSIINKYAGKMPVYHLDFYRLERAKDIEELGIEEFCGEEGITLIEWPERVLEFLPQKRWEIKIDILGENKRSFNTEYYGIR